jgi:hypothetical protein
MVLVGLFLWALVIGYGWWSQLLRDWLPLADWLRLLAGIDLRQPLAGVAWLQVLSDLGNFLAGLSLFFLIASFVRERGSAERAQVDQLAAWADIDPDSSPLPRIQIHLHNTSKLPMQIVQVGVDLRSRWLAADDPRSGRLLLLGDIVDDPTEKSTIFFPGVRLLPESIYEDHQYVGPPPEMWKPTLQGIAGDLGSIVVIDSAGRRWRWRPGRGEPPKRHRRLSSRRLTA